MATLELTERHLCVPYKLAARYARQNSDWFDELVAVGMLALVEAAQTYDETKSQAITHLTMRVKWAMWEACRLDKLRWDRLGSLSLEDVVEQSGGRLMDVDELAVDRRRHHEDVIADREEAEQALSVLVERDREEYYWHYHDGLSMVEIAALRGRTRQMISLRMIRSQETLQQRSVRKCRY